MSPSYEAIAVAAVLLFVLGDGWIRRNRRLQRPTVSDEDFLRGYLRDHGVHDSQLAPEILDLRRTIGRELGLPALKLAPGDDLSDLCDRYCPMFTGSVVWNDLFDDLQDLRRKAGLPATDEVPETVGRYIDLALEHKVGPRPKPPG